MRHDEKRLADIGAPMTQASDNTRKIAMRRMTVDEQRRVLSTLARNRNGADMMVFDAVCYGGQLEEYRDARDHIDRVIKAFPADIRKAYDAELRKTRADRLRAEADKIERGDRP